MNRVTGHYKTTQSHNEAVHAFVPFPLPPTKPELDPHVWQEQNTRAELASPGLSGMSGLVASGEWLIYSALRREALLTSQLEGTQATLTDVLMTKQVYPLPMRMMLKKLHNICRHSGMSGNKLTHLKVFLYRCG